MSVEKRRPGVWRVRWREHGRHRSRTFSGRDAFQEAKAFDREVAGRGRQGAFAPAEPSAMRLEAWLEIWFRRRGPLWTPKNLANRAWVVDRWVAPFIGGVRLRDLSRQVLEDWIAAMLGAGASPNTVNGARSIVSAALGAAVESGEIPVNPVMGMRKVRQMRPQRRAWPPVVFELVRWFLEPRDRMMVDLMLLAGLRPSEAIACTWEQVGSFAITIDRAAPDGTVQTTKTTAVDIAPILPVLRERLDAFAAGRTLAGPIVRGRQGDGVMQLKYWRRHYWRPAVARAALDPYPRPYDCRHAFGSLLINEGRNLLEVSRAMRHAKTQMTQEKYLREFAEQDLVARTSFHDAITTAHAAVESAASTKAFGDAVRRGKGVLDVVLTHLRTATVNPGRDGQRGNLRPLPGGPASLLYPISTQPPETAAPGVASESDGLRGLRARWAMQGSNLRPPACRDRPGEEQRTPDDTERHANVGETRDPAEPAVNPGESAGSLPVPTMYPDAGGCDAVHQDQSPDAPVGDLGGQRVGRRHLHPREVMHASRTTGPSGAHAAGPRGAGQPTLQLARPMPPASHTSARARDPESPARAQDVQEAGGSVIRDPRAHQARANAHRWWHTAAAATKGTR